MISLRYTRFLNENIEIVAKYIRGGKERGQEGEEMKVKRKLFNVQTSSTAHWVPGFFLMNKAAGA